MTKKRKRSTIGKTMRDFDKIVGGNPTRMYQGESPAPVDKRALRRMAARTAKIAEKLDAEGQIYLEAFSKHRTHKAAWLSLHPDGNPNSAGKQGWLVMEKIRKVISEKEIKAMLGVSPEAIIAAVGRGLIAKAEKIFIVAKTGQIVKSEPFDDTANQLVAARLGAQMEGMIGGDEGKSDPVIVTLISYNPPGFSQWPGGGRAPSPPQPNTHYVPYERSPAKALPVDLGGPGGRDD